MIWFLNLITESIINIILPIAIVIWVIGFVLNFLPLFHYRIIIQLMSIIILAPSIWFYSSIHYQEQNKKDLDLLQQKINLAEDKSNQLNNQLEEKIKELDELRHKKKDVITKIITKTVKEFDNKCELSNAFIRVHDASSQNAIPSSSKPNDGTTSNVKASEFLQTVTDNYSTYYQMRDRLIQWQEWYNKQRKIYEEVK